MTQATSQRGKGAGLALFLIAYVIVVLAIDCLATRGVMWPIDWHMFIWRPQHWAASHSIWLRMLTGFDAYKFTAWFVIPFLICLRWMDWSWFSFKRWRRIDGFILLGLFIAGAIAVVSVKFVPSLRAMYPSESHLPAEQRLIFIGFNLAWIVSWLTGWEFVHRYALLRHIKRAWPNHAYLIALLVVPAIEGLYHVAQGKSPLESAAMWAFSLVLCTWALRRENALLPFIAHAFIEISLVFFMAFV